MNKFVTLFEVGPRDGLQNIAQMVATAYKIRLVDLLTDCGFRKIEVASFVSPKWVPQMADNAQVLAGIKRGAAVNYAALTPNMQGFHGAVVAKADEIAVFASASEGFSRKNINCSISESLERFVPVIEAAKPMDLPVRGYLSCVVECPFDGPTDPAQVAKVAAQLFDMGCYEISLGDTIGRATPDATARMLDAVLAVLPAGRLAGHFHDTGGQALANIKVALGKGLRVFDAAVGGLGGCPYAPGASGNVATEAVLTMVHALGFETGIDPKRLAKAVDFARSLRVQ